MTLAVSIRNLKGVNFDRMTFCL